MIHNGIKIIGDKTIYYLDAKEVTEKEYREVFPMPEMDARRFKGKNHNRNWPMLSDGAGVVPSQIPEAMEADRKKGVPTDYAADGRAIFRDRDHRKRFLKAHGMRDNDGGYGD